MAELAELNGLVHSLHGGPLIGLLAQHVEVGTMSDEIGFFSHGIFDEVRGSPCTASPRLACASWLLLYLPFSDPSAASCPAAIPDQAA